MNVEIESQLLTRGEIETLRHVYEIMDEDDIEEVTLEHTVAHICGHELPEDEESVRRPTTPQLAHADSTAPASSPTTRSILFGDGRSVRVEDHGGRYKLRALKDEAGSLRRTDFKELCTKFSVPYSDTHVYIQSPVAMRPARSQDMKVASTKAERRMTFDIDSNVGLVPLVKDPVDMLATVLHKETLEPLTDESTNPIQFFVSGKTLTKCYAHALGSDVKPSALGRFNKHGELYKVQTPSEVLFFEDGVTMAYEKEPVDNLSQEVLFDRIDKHELVEVTIDEPCYVVYDHATQKVHPIAKRTFDQAYHFMERDRFLATPKGLYRRQSMLGQEAADSAYRNGQDAGGLMLRRVGEHPVGGDGGLQTQRSLSGGRAGLRANVQEDFRRLKAQNNHGNNPLLLRYMILALSFVKKSSASSFIRMVDLTAFVSIFERLKSESVRLIGKGRNAAVTTTTAAAAAMATGSATLSLASLLLIFIIGFPLAGFPCKFRDDLFGYARVYPVTRPPHNPAPTGSDFALYAAGLAIYASIIASVVNVLADASSFGFLDIVGTWILGVFVLTQLPCFLLNHRTMWDTAITHLRLSSYVVTMPERLRPENDSLNKPRAMRTATDTKNSFLTAYDFYMAIARGRRGSTLPPLLQAVRAAILAVVLAGFYVGIYVNSHLPSKHGNGNNAIFGSVNTLCTLLTSAAAFASFEYALREVHQHGGDMRRLAATRGAADAKVIDFMWPENVVAWRHVQKTLVEEKNNFVDVSASLGIVLGLAKIATFIVCICVEEDGVYGIRPELVFLVQGAICLAYGLAISREGIAANSAIQAVRMTLSVAEADIVTESPVINAEHLPFDPRPPDLSRVQLPKFVEDLIHRLAENAHDVWSKRKLQDGWVYGEKNDVQKKRHTDLIHYKYLSCVTQSYDYLMVQETTKALYAMGYRVRRPIVKSSMNAVKCKTMNMPLDKSGKPVVLPNGYIPAPVETRVDDMPVSLMELNEALATHVHHKWARSRMDQGYTYGDKRCDDPDAPSGLRHPFLKRFEHLDDETKEANRNASAEILKTMSALGFKIGNAYSTTSSLLLPLEQRRTASLRNIQSLQPIVAVRSYMILGCRISNFLWAMFFVVTAAIALTAIVLLFVQQ